jgi:hypothetical protein
MEYLRELASTYEPNLPYIDPAVLDTANVFLNTTISVGVNVFNASPTTYPRIEIKSQTVNITSCKITSTLFTSTGVSPKVSTRVITNDVARKLFILQQQVPFENEMYLATYMDSASSTTSATSASQNAAYIRGFLCYIAWISLIEDGYIWVSDYNFFNSKNTYLTLAGLYYTDLIMEYEYAAVSYNYSLLLSTALGWSRVWRDPLYAIIIGTFEVLYLQNYYNQAHDLVSLETAADWYTRYVVFSALKK